MTHTHNRYRIPPDVHCRIEHEAALEGISPRSFLIRAVEDECAIRLILRRHGSGRQADWLEVLRKVRDLSKDTAGGA